MSRVIITVEYKDPLQPSKSTKPLLPEEAVSVMREVMFRVACGEYVAAYVTRESPLKVHP